MNTTIHYSDTVTAGDYFAIPAQDDEEGRQYPRDGFYCADTLADLLSFIESEGCKVWKDEIHFARCDDLSCVVHRL